MARDVLSSRSQTGPPILGPKGTHLAVAGHNGMKRLDEIWYQTWIFVVNWNVEWDIKEGPIRMPLVLDMTVERMECTDGRGLDALTTCILRLRNKIPWFREKASKSGRFDQRLLVFPEKVRNWKEYLMAHNLKKRDTRRSFLDFPEILEWSVRHH